MMRSVYRLTVLLCTLLPAVPAIAQAGVLKVGDAAPPLAGITWVKGAPVDFPKDFGKKIYVVEFWATWCPPCKASIPLLTETQKKFKDDLVIVGVTTPDDRGNSKAAVEKFVKDQGDAMSYTVAFDAQSKAQTAYMEAAHAMGIPHAFIIGKDGKIAWQGSPLEPEMQDVIGSMASGRFDPALRQKVNQKLNELSPQLQRGDWTGVRDGLIDVLKLDPSSNVAMEVLIVTYAERLNDAVGLRTWAAAFMEQHKSDGAVMHLLARKLLDLNNKENVAARQPELMLRAAEAAHKASASKPRGDVTATYAEVVFQIGAVDKAIAIQTEAVQQSAPEARPPLQAVLDYYTKCKQLRDAG